MSALTMRTIAIPGSGGRRTTMRLEPEYWSALAEIAARERMTVSEYLSRTLAPGARNCNRTSAVRVHVLRHYRELADRCCATWGGATQAEAERMATEFTKENAHGRSC